jgi:hypothetical protein
LRITVYFCKRLPRWLRKLGEPARLGGAQMAIFTAEGQPFHLIADGVSAFAGLPPRRS